MRLLGFQIRPVSGPEIVDFVILNGRKTGPKSIKNGGVLRPHQSKWVWDRLAAV